MSGDHERFMREAFVQAKKSYDEGGLPIGAVMVENGVAIAAGHNRRVQDGDPIAHGEMNDADCTELMSRFIRERPELWDEDIAGS